MRAQSRKKKGARQQKGGCGWGIVLFAFVSVENPERKREGVEAVPGMRGGGNMHMQSTGNIAVCVKFATLANLYL